MVVFLRWVAAVSAFLGAGISLRQYFAERRARAGWSGLLLLVAGLGWTGSALTYEGEQDSKVSKAEQRYQDCLDEVRQDQAESGFGDEIFITPEDLCAYLNPDSDH